MICSCRSPLSAPAAPQPRCGGKRNKALGALGALGCVTALTGGLGVTTGPAGVSSGSQPMVDAGAANQLSAATLLSATGSSGCH